MLTNSSKKVILSILLITVMVGVVTFFIGLPAPNEKNIFSEEELNKVHNLGIQLAKLMGQVTSNPESCPEVLGLLANYSSEIDPITERLFSSKTEDVLQDPRFEDVKGLPDALAWIETKCKNVNS